MSNQVGLILSFIFLSFFIVFSGEIISYQRFSATCLSKTNHIALYIQKNGYDIDDNLLIEQLDYFDEYLISSEDKENGFIAYHLSTTTEYEAFSSMFEFLSKDVSFQLTIYRKEK